MPTYDYKCSQCGIVREYVQKMSDAPLTECPECGGPFKRIITSVGIIFKGSGFHVNDYRSGSKPTGGGGGGEKPADKKPSADSDKGSGGDSTSGSTDKPATSSSGGDAGAAKSEAAA